MFKKPYTVRQYQPQKNIDGHFASPYSDTIMRLNVQPLTPDDLKALPEGDRTVKRLKSFGKSQLKSADEFSGVSADRLFYDGLWYECVSSNLWDHTLLSHYESKFVLLPPNEQEKPPTPPDSPDVAEPRPKHCWHKKGVAH